ncbi:hypothetical protein CEW46_21495 [Bacillus cereus]|nr:hypothetical protein CEW46_21495 [Bacillus cereus]
MTTTKLGFHYDPISLTKLMLQIYIEKYVEDEADNEAIVRASYKYLSEVTEDELTEVLNKYVTDNNVEYITFEDHKGECKLIFDAIRSTDSYKSFELEFYRRGYGSTGLGVIDKKDGIYYDCEFAQHWFKVIEILTNKYPRLGEALSELEFRNNLQEYNGVTRKEIDSFIMENFELVGGNRGLENYTES